MFPSIPWNFYWTVTPLVIKDENDFVFVVHPGLIIIHYSCKAKLVRKIVTVHWKFPWYFKRNTGTDDQVEVYTTMCTIGYCTHSLECAILNNNYLKGAERVEIYMKTTLITRWLGCHHYVRIPLVQRLLEIMNLQCIIAFFTSLIFLFLFSFLHMLIFSNRNAYQLCVGLNLIY